MTMPNAKCHCGSGRKHKKCCGRFEHMSGKADRMPPSSVTRTPRRHVGLAALALLMGASFHGQS